MLISLFCCMVGALVGVVSRVLFDWSLVLPLQNTQEASNAGMPIPITNACVKLLFIFII